MQYINTINALIWVVKLLHSGRFFPETYGTDYVKNIGKGCLSARKYFKETLTANFEAENDVLWIYKFKIVLLNKTFFGVPKNFKKNS